MTSSQAVSLKLFANRVIENQERRYAEDAAREAAERAAEDVIDEAELLAAKLIVLLVMLAPLLGLVAVPGLTLLPQKPKPIRLKSYKTINGLCLYIYDGGKQRF